MLPSELLSKPLNQWNVDDLNLIIERQSEESQFLEFKEYMPLNRGALGWNFGGSLHANERDGLAKEIVAFANAYGGHLIVGIKENKEKPSRAEKLGDVNSNVAELAERLRSALNSIIDPPINGLQIQPIIFNETDGGFIVIHVPQSIHAPHGYGKPPEAYVRRADRSEPMTMRDMQSVFWEARTRRERIDQEVLRFSQFFNEYRFEANRLAFGFVAVSENQIDFGNIWKYLRDTYSARETGNFPKNLFSTENLNSCADEPSNFYKWLPYSRGVSYDYFSTSPSDGNVQQGTWSVDDSGVVYFIGNKEGYKPLPGRVFGSDANAHQIRFSQEELLATLKQFLDLIRLISFAKPDLPLRWIVKGYFRTVVDPIFVSSNTGDYTRVNLKGGSDFRSIIIDLENLNLWPEYLSRRVWESFETVINDSHANYLGDILNSHWSQW